MSEKEKKDVSAVSGGHLSDDNDQYVYRCPKCGTESIYFTANEDVKCWKCKCKMKFIRIIPGEKIRFGVV